MPQNQYSTFVKIYKESRWCTYQQESVSGTGSTLRNTETLRLELPKICKKYGIKNIVDIACGDFNWMKEIVNEFDYYRGVDIVDALIKVNKDKYEKKNHIEFIKADAIDDFGKCIEGRNFDAVILKDVLVHFPNEYVLKVLKSLNDSPIRYVFITHFDSIEANIDIAGFKGWRPQNFTLSPWEMNKPLESISSLTEIYKWGNNDNTDKTLSLWQIK
jgi:hypothetical protein